MSHLQPSLVSGNISKHGLGFSLVALFHVALLLALAKGLGVSGFILNQPQSHVTVIPPPTEVVPPRPRPIDPTITWGRAEPIPMPGPFDPPQEAAKPTPTEGKPIAGDGATPTGPAGPMIERAHTDPAHPLTQPTYPASSRRLGEHGTVELQLYILADGRVADARIGRSSGFPRLDAAALEEALRSWRLLPMRENGVAVAGWGSIAITFRLTK
jgi:protein TonB